MARCSSLVSLQQIGHIDMTPLMDLTFILLITFIITFPLIEQSVVIDLPKEKAAEAMKPDAHSISLDLEGRFYMDNAPISEAQLRAALSDIGKHDLEAKVYVRADRGLPYGEVIEVMHMLHEAHITKIGLVTEAEF